MGVVPSHRDLEEWLTICPEEDKDRVRALFQRDIEEGRSGLNVRREDGPILFTHPMLLLRAERNPSSQLGWAAQKRTRPSEF